MVNVDAMRDVTEAKNLLDLNGDKRQIKVDKISRTPFLGVATPTVSEQPKKAKSSIHS
ncbi:MAG: hypothetical protein PV340_05450 [Wolbachia sp.]|nr:hypothetical protein [Wolbachia sp.]MDD9336405.1 hypothetical protein [Wolbachia sp.]